MRQSFEQLRQQVPEAENFRARCTFWGNGDASIEVGPQDLWLTRLRKASWAPARRADPDHISRRVPMRGSPDAPYLAPGGAVVIESAGWTYLFQQVEAEEANADAILATFAPDPIDMMFRVETSRFDAYTQTFAATFPDGLVLTDEMEPDGLFVAVASVSTEGYRFKPITRAGTAAEDRTSYPDDEPVTIAFLEGVLTLLPDMRWIVEDYMRYPRFVYASLAAIEINMGFDEQGVGRWVSVLRWLEPRWPHLDPAVQEAARRCLLPAIQVEKRLGSLDARIEAEIGPNLRPML